MANEIDIDFGTFDLNDTNDLTIGAIEVKENKTLKVHDIPKMEGAVAEQAKRREISISVKGDVVGSDYDDLRTNIDALKAALQDGEQKFTTDDDRYIMGQMKSFKYDYVMFRRMAKWSAEFVAPYPFWLSETLHSDERTPTSGAGYTVTNSGNAPTRAKITFTAPGGGVSNDIQMENTTRNELFTYAGDITAYESLEVDNRVDTEDFEVLNDGVDDHTNFSGDFIFLSPGINTLEFTGTANVIVKVEWRDAWY